MAHPLIEAWSRQEFTHPPYTFTGDNLPSSRCIDIRSRADLIQHENYPPRDSRFHVGLLPVPFMGHLETAKVYIALLNPGLTACDYYVEETAPEYKEYLRRNLKQDLGSEQYPFFKLNPKWDWTSAGIWWHRALGEIICEVAKARSCCYRDAAEFVAKRIAALELAPYHSVNGKFVSSGPKSSESSRLMMRFVRDEVIPRANRGDALLVITRGIEKWDIEESDNVIVYPSKHARTASLSMKSRGGPKILKRLLHP